MTWAPRCAARLHTGLCADCTHLDVDVANYIQFLRESSTLDVDGTKWDMEDRNLKMTRPAFGGHLMATIICPRFRPCMATVRPGVMKKNPFDQAKADACEIVKPAFSLTEADIHTEVTEVVKAAKKLVDLIGADYIVSVGRGISKDVEGGIKLAEELADVLGRRRWRLSCHHRQRLALCRPSGWPDRQDRASEGVHRSGHLRRHPAQGRHAGFRVHHRGEEVIYLRLAGEFSFREIGELLGRSEVWARVRFYRGKEALARNMGGEHHGGQ